VRAYNLVITKIAPGATTADVIPPAETINGVTTLSPVVITPPSKPYKQYTSLIGGVPNPGALHIEFDIPVTIESTVINQAQIKIHGISRDDISSAANLNGLYARLYGGMVKGLPLANPKQYGLLAQGLIYQAFGNWVLTDMSLDIIVIADGGTDVDPKNLTLTWPKNTQLADAITDCFTTAFPTYTAPSVNISDQLVKAGDVNHVANSIGEMAQFLKSVSKSILTDDAYSGVLVSIKNNQIFVFDSMTVISPGGTTMDSPIQISYTDLIGQPTWSSFNEIDFNVVMRADISVGDFIHLPPSPVINTFASLPNFRSRLAFSGIYRVSFMRHVGSFRQADALAWVTNIKAFGILTSGNQVTQADIQVNQGVS
jgi:hypothetical protein